MKSLGNSIRNESYNEKLARLLPNFTREAFAEYMNDRLVRADLKLIKTPFHLLRFVTELIQYFEMKAPKSTRMLSRLDKTNQAQEKEVRVVVSGLDEKINIAGMLTPGVQNLERVSMPQILLCRDTTNKYEIKTFLMRAIHDNSRPYFVMGTHYLHAENQNIFCDILDWALQSEYLKEKMYSMNLYFVDNSFN